MLVDDLGRGRLTKVNATAVVHDGSTVEELSNLYGIFNRVEGTDNAAKGLEGREGVQWCMLGDEVSDCLQGGWSKDG